MNNTELHSISEIENVCQKAKSASRIFCRADRGLKDKILRAVADSLLLSSVSIIEANEVDLREAVNAGKPLSYIDRLRLTKQRISQMSEGVLEIISLPDPVGLSLDAWTTAKGLRITKRSVPLGVVGIIYEARPNVTVDTAALCIKSGNAVVLRGSADAIHSNRMLSKIIRNAVLSCGAPADIVSLIEDTSRKGAEEFMTMHRYIDVLVPRGSVSLIQTVKNIATIPVIETGTGNCHIYIDSTADHSISDDIIINAKTQRVSVCNAAETLLVHRDHKSGYLKHIIGLLIEKGVTLYGCPDCVEADSRVLAATDEDYYTEYLDMKLAVKVIDSAEEAVGHINKYSSGHSEVIVAKNKQNAEFFLQNVDSACVYVNASTRFSDGYEFGLGAELGISNQKIHARGPVGLKELTSYKYEIIGDGQVRS